MLGAALAAGFAALVGLRLHGFSLAAWHGVIDGSPAPEVLLGAPRPVRTDDWLVHLPLAFAQLRHDPPFPPGNDLVGFGQSAWVPLELPVAHPLTLLRPELLGFFLGPDVGLAWLWWARVLGLFGVWLAVLARVGGGRLGLAAAGSALLVASPFFQFWSLNAAPMAIGAGLVFLAGTGLARARRPAAIAAAAAGLALAGGCFLLALYPPYQIVLGWLVLALGAGWLAAGRRRLPLGERAALRLAGGAAAALFVGAVGLAYLHAAGGALETMRHTVYPGARVETGGGVQAAALANASLGAPLWASEWEGLGNVCEAASFLWIGPVAAAFALARSLSRREAPDPVVAALTLYAGALAAYALVGFPGWLARATLLSQVPARRAVIGLGVADLLLAVRFLARAAPARPGERLLAGGIAAAWGLALAACVPALHGALPEAPTGALLAAAGANGALAYAVLAGRRRALPMVLLAVAAALSSLWFNPLARGGASYLAENPVAERILAIDREAGGSTTWAVFGAVDLANLFRAIGVHCLNGTLPVPQLAMWERLDPEGRYRDVYDRYGWASFVATPATTASFATLADDAFAVYVNPGSPGFLGLGVTHVVLRGGDPGVFARLSGFRSLGAVGPNQFYAVVRPAAPTLP
jgi:hypothetical protein